MSNEAIIWLSVCGLTLAISVAGIVLLQKTGRAGKYAWSVKDTKQLAGCFVYLVLGLPVLGGLGYVTENRPFFDSTWIGGILFYVLLNVLLGASILIIRKAVKVLEEWIDRKYQGRKSTPTTLL